MWYGAIVDIPAGWVHCDGNNGTPNLIGKFLVGAGAGYIVGATGGALTHTHPFTSSGHVHDFAVGLGVAAGTDYDDTSNAGFGAGTTDAGGEKPPYHTLAYIMKT